MWQLDSVVGGEAMQCRFRWNAIQADVMGWFVCFFVVLILSTVLWVEIPGGWVL